MKFVNEYPLTVSGKVQKYILRNELEDEKKSGKIDEYRVKQVRWSMKGIINPYKYQSWMTIFLPTR